ncbi:MAG TPA: type I restriction-modification enzyme R subunit C-terminal domain-containing protein [Candidatus Bathyarchaeia archaeon]|nr:type I restriction-modification enzyme R subunit C-terminal domain-containing protein [Candidatus Bathyarchaeia archaeon]
MRGSKSESTTRQQLIDKALTEAGWPVEDFRANADYDTTAVREYETSKGPADYVLFVNGVALGAVEAKREGLDPQNVLSQARRYAKGYNNGSFVIGEYHLPFVFSTNGRSIWFQDLREEGSRSRIISKFWTPQGLEELFSRDLDSWKEWLKVNPNNHAILWDFQREAVSAVERALISGKDRMLVAMATGTGKTIVAVSLIHRLLKSGAARRVLFLVDRRALAAQAVGAFASFEVQPGLKFAKEYEVYSQSFRREDVSELSKFNSTTLPEEYLLNPDASKTFVYICTIQRMRMYLYGKESIFEETSGEIDEEPDIDALPIPIHAFDFLVADECHRGYTSTEEGKWRQVLDHFDAVKVGLTATPAAHTTSYFKDIVYRYDVDQAVRENHLVDYDAVDIESDITMKGLFLKQGELVKLVDPATGSATYDALEDEREFDTTEIERKVTAVDRNRKIVKEFAKYALEQEKELGHFPKTLVFAVNDLPFTSHADQVVNRLRDEFGRGDTFVEKITGSPTVDRPLQKIREFRNRPEPSIVVTVDMLTTGVDVPRIENLVFLRPVKSRILFTQMMGRGTRKCDEINKDHFTVFDCFGGTLLEYFRKATDFTADPPTKPYRGIREVLDSIYGNRDRDYNVRVLVRRLQRIEKSVSAEGRESFARFIPGGDLAGFADSLPDRLETDWPATIDVLRNKAFQDLAENYPRAKVDFIISEGAEDYVTSQYVFRTIDGKELKPQDYLQAFERFVKENPDHIQALSILLGRPSDFHTAELTELRKKLASRPERFTEENLRRAYQNELADIISIIRHAAKGEPLMAATERVDRAIAKVRVGKTFNAEQEKWLKLIRDHLIKNIVVDEPDFQGIPFSRHGGLERADEVFGGRLVQIIQQVDEAMLT